MSGKSARKDRKEILDKLKTVNAESDPKAVAEEMAKSIDKMVEDRDKKAKSAKELLVKQLEVTASKYLTANGVMSAMQVVRDVYGEGILSIEVSLETAKTMAQRMSKLATKMADAAETLEPVDMARLCDTFYDAHFAERPSDPTNLVYELLSLQLCQNVGPSAEDVAEFCAHADDEIAKARERLAEHRAEHGLEE